MFQRVLLGKSVEGRSIHAFAWVPSDAPVSLVLGGIHGDEPKSVFVARRLIEHLDAAPRARSRRGWVVVPLVNPDGYERRKRRNANLVDINRNFPTENWAQTSARSRMFGGTVPAGEPETRAILQAVRRWPPALIIAVHSINRGRYCNNYDGPGGNAARRMAKRNGYPLRASIGYPTPGSLGTWAGRERKIATVTLELPSQHSSKRCWEDNVAALLSA